MTNHNNTYDPIPTSFVEQELTDGRMEQRNEESVCDSLPPLLDYNPTDSYEHTLIL